MDYRSVFWSGLLALAVSALITPLVRAVSRRLGAVAQPRADRYHTRPTALFGGVAIFAGFAASFLLQWPQGVRHLLLAAGCAGAMFVLGLLDDLLSFRPLTKLLGQVAVAATFSLAGPRLVYTFVPALDVVITILWLVGITNALNLLDNLDGLAAGVTVIAAGFLTYFFLAAGQPVEAGVTVALAAAALGFLIYNWHPATIFMGDSGSLLLGFMLAAVTLFNQSHRTRNLLATLGVPLLILLVPILDTTLVTLARRAHGRAVGQGGTDHISHRLVALGLSDRLTVGVIYVVAIASGMMAVFVRHLSPILAVAAVGLFMAVLVCGLLVLVRVRVYSSSSATRPADGPAPEETVRLGRAAPAPSKELVFTWLAKRPQLLLAIYDAIAVVFCYYLAFVLRFGNNPLPFLQSFVRSLPLVVIVQLGLLWATGLYRTLWQYGSATDVARLGLSVLVAVAGSVAATTFLFRFELLSRAAFAIDAVLLFLALVFGRYASRATRLLSQRQDRARDERALILGAGTGGDTALRELRESLRWGLRPVGFLDDDPAKQGRRVRGLKVLGGLEALERLAMTHRARVILVAIQHLPEEAMAALTRRCQEAGLTLRRFRLGIEEVVPLSDAIDPATPDPGEAGTLASAETGTPDREAAMPEHVPEAENPEEGPGDAP